MLRQNFPNSNFIKIDYLLTECEVYMGKYLPKISVQTKRQKSKVCAEKTEGKFFTVQSKQTKLIRD